jgi:hypothetical protein
MNPMKKSSYSTSAGWLERFFDPTAILWAVIWAVLIELVKGHSKAIRRRLPLVTLLAIFALLPAFISVIDYSMMVWYVHTLGYLMISVVVVNTAVQVTVASIDLFVVGVTLFARVVRHILIWQILLTLLAFPLLAFAGLVRVVTEAAFLAVLGSSLAWPVILSSIGLVVFGPRLYGTKSQAP